MKFLKYIISISLLTFLALPKVEACGPYYPDDPNNIRLFRSTPSDDQQDWKRFSDRQENCLLWQRITSPSIPYTDIEKVIYTAKLSDLNDMTKGKLSDNKFAQWLSHPSHKEDLDIVLTAKEIEELRAYLYDPWYYAYEGDEEHQRLQYLTKKCQSYSGKRHASRYALQLVRLYFTAGNFQECINLWEKSVSKMPQNIVTDMSASYVGGAYTRMGNRKEAIKLFTRSQDIESLMALNVWDDSNAKSHYSDARVKELEYIFNRFPNSPLLGERLQKYVGERESYVYDNTDWDNRDIHDPVNIKSYRKNDSPIADDEHEFYAQLKSFANKVVASPKCRNKGLWHYALGYLHYLDGDNRQALASLQRAEKSGATPFIKESIHAFRFMMDAYSADNSRSFNNKIYKHVQWLDNCMKNDISTLDSHLWHENNRLNWRIYYWQDLARKALLGIACPRLYRAGNTTLALQLANFASNHILQLSPYIKAYNTHPNIKRYNLEVTTLTLVEYRNEWPKRNDFDYSNQFFDWIMNSSAAEAAGYADRIINPQNDLDKYLNGCGYVDQDYICDIVGTLYLREMNYDKAVAWMSKVSSEYQNRTNIAKSGYFKRDPFKYQSDKKHFISDSKDYKLRFGKEMARLKKVMMTDANPNVRAEAKIRYAIGLRNSFGRCWYLTKYGLNSGYEPDEDEDYRYDAFYSYSRRAFREDNYAQIANKQADTLTKTALKEFTDPERAAKAHLEMLNFATVIKSYPGTRSAKYIRGHCDTYRDYAIYAHHF